MNKIIFTNYDIESSEYLGKSVDLCGRIFEAFLINDNLHIVYNLNTNMEYSTYENINKIKNNLDEYLYTPYIEFIS